MFLLPKKIYEFQREGYHNYEVLLALNCSQAFPNLFICSSINYTRLLKPWYHVYILCTKEYHNKTYWLTECLYNVMII